MPRDGSGVFSLPPGTTNFVALTTIESDKIDAITGDLQADANTARPIVAGGSGASTVIGAFDAFQTHGADIATAATLVLDGATGEMVDLTGTTSVTAVTLATGKRREARAAGAFKLTASASLIVNGSTTQSYTCSAGDLLCFEGYASSVVRVWVVARSLDSTSRVRRNRIVNPAMQISQENGTTAGTTSGRFPADQWQQFFVTSAGTLTVAQVASVTPKGSKNRIRGTVTVADASLAAGEYWILTQNIEGNQVADFQYGTAAALKSVVQFGFKGPAGTYSISLQNSAINRSFVQTFVVSVANTDAYFTIPIPSGDMTGTWLTDTGLGISLNIVLSSGSTFQGTNGAWQAGNILGTSGNSNGMGTGAAVFELFDVQFHLDPDGTGIAPAWEMPDYGQALKDSQRFFASYGGTSLVETVGAGEAQSATAAQIHVQYPVPMRAVPSLAVSANSDFSLLAANGTQITMTAATIGGNGLQTALITCAVASGLVAGNSTLLIANSTTSARLRFSTRY